ncbi:TauD/TfdA family dioxygenase [Nocardia sp. CNY236]|uniref:TauD/TfdA family dioxygenase n=1 Tax=Nocardia sp. CNY236 TaxID=1169152 RepID=UPI000490FC37|nr:TauD/TfdA family dioxygenase [Nocardia sp. CNY236]
MTIRSDLCTDDPAAAGSALDTDSSATVARIRKDCRNNGFALFTVEDPVVSGRSILAETARLLDLGSTYVPAVYATAADRFGYDVDGFNTISPTAASTGHRAFGTCVAQGFHTDGTLEPIGHVETSLLWFDRAARAGGHTTIFRAVEAFEYLRHIDPVGAAALTTDDALTRVAKSFQPPPRASGPAFAELAGRGLRTRWADDGTEIWQLAGSLGEQRAAAVVRLRELSQPGGRYRQDIAVPSRTGLVLCNGRIAHGRTAFAAGIGERVLIRGLYTREVA